MSKAPNLVAEIFSDAKPQDKKAKILEQVRGLLAQAEGTDNPHEADAFRAKADQQMALYAIEQWEVKESAERGVYRPKPEIRWYDFNWYYVNEFSSELYSMFTYVAQHCRVVIAHRGHGKGDHGFREIPLIGIPSDLDWFDMLFTSIMLQMANQLEPKPDHNKSFEENCYILRMSGMNRLRIAELLWKADMLPGTGIDTSQPFDNLYSPTTKKALRAIRKAGEAYSTQHGLETTKISTGVWQRSFASGFRSEVNRRLRVMLTMREQAPEMQSEDNHMALVLKDIYTMALELYEEQWPEPTPRPVEHGSDQKRRRVSMARYKPPKMSDRAINAGREAGARVNLSGHPGQRLGGKRKELDQ